MTEQERREYAAKAVREYIFSHPSRHVKPKVGYIREEGAREIARLKALPDSAFPVRFEKSDTSGLVFLSREEMIERVKRNIEYHYSVEEGSIL